MFQGGGPWAVALVIDSVKVVGIGAAVREAVVDRSGVTVERLAMGDLYPSSSPRFFRAFRD